MNPADFLRIECDRPGPSKHFVVHFAEPKFALELVPDGDAPDRVGRGVIKRLRVPNSWAGDYGQYARWMTAAQDFFTQSLAGPPPSGFET